MLQKPDCVFMPSGVMAQQIALCIHRKGAVRSTFVAHASSHILLHENDTATHLLNMQLRKIDTQEPVCLADVMVALEHPGVSTVLIENPHRELGGSQTSFEDLVAIKALCKEKGVAFHLDGARIWEVSGAFSGKYSIGEIASNFDSVYCSFYKGLGGLAGAVLAGDDEFCKEARVWLRRFGGNVYSMAPHIVSCYAGFRRHVSLACQGMTFVDKANKMKSVAKALTADEAIRKVLKFRVEPIEICFAHVILSVGAEQAEAVRDRVLTETGVKLFSRIRLREWGGSKKQCLFEWNMGELNGSFEDAVFVDAWKNFAQIVAEEAGGLPVLGSVE